MTSLPLPYQDFNQIGAALQAVAVRLADAASDIGTAAHPMAVGLHAANMPGCTYAAVAIALGIKAYLAKREQQHETANDHALHSGASAILAATHFLAQ